MATGERWRGAAREADNALCMVVSTGMGGGLVIDGRVHSGPTGNAGHIGHIGVEMNEDPCVCGARGCVEQAAGGPAITRTALSLGWRPRGARRRPPGLWPHRPGRAARRRSPPSTGRPVRSPRA
ncbi:ROK family protein [Streptomyces sp. NPDC016626]|uniref:ROK family protein n=1 Tax=Streptomyces sp. NPDC016626 TaxID=3364968 RepID=UPI0036FDC7E7